MLEILDAARRLAVLYGIERTVVDADSLDTLTERLGSMAGRSRR